MTRPSPPRSVRSSSNRGTARPRLYSRNRGCHRGPADLAGRGRRILERPRMNVRRWPNVSPTDPPKRIRPARVSRYAFATHCDAPNPTPSSNFIFGSATLTTELSMNPRLDPSMEVGSTQRGSRPAGRTADGVSQGAFWKPTSPMLLAPMRPTPAVRDCEVFALDGGPFQLGRGSGPAQRGRDLRWLLANREVGLDERAADPAFCVDHVGRGNGQHPVR
jgi:hypothetical protein